jgi:hypothetical protein
MGELTVPDFELCHLIGLYDFVLTKNSLENPFLRYDNLLSIKKNVESLPGVKEYRQSREHKQMPWIEPGSANFPQNSNPKQGTPY